MGIWRVTAKLRRFRRNKLKTSSVQRFSDIPISAWKPWKVIALYVKVWVWRGLYPLLKRFCREHGVSVNRVVNLAIQSFLGGCDVEELKLQSCLDGLLRRESRLRKIQNCMLRSGAYLKDYAVKRLGVPVGAPKPLKALSGREALVFQKICAEREKVAGQIMEIVEKLLENVEPLRVEGETFQDYVKRKLEKGGENG